jgi:hypothetical protein
MDCILIQVKFERGLSISVLGQLSCQKLGFKTEEFSKKFTSCQTPPLQRVHRIQGKLSGGREAYDKVKEMVSSAFY